MFRQSGGPRPPARGAGGGRDAAIFAPLVGPIAGDERGWKPVAASRVGRVSDTEGAFELMEGLTFTDGYGPVTAEDVEFSIERFGIPPLGMSGPYLLDDWVPKQRTVLRRNPDWPGEPGGFEEIRIVPIDDPATAERGFESGDLDCTRTAVSSPPPSTIRWCAARCSTPSTARRWWTRPIAARPPSRPA